MDIKINQATTNRPEGTRVLDAPALLVHLNNFEELIKDEKAWNEGDRNGITVFKNETLTVLLTALKADALQQDVITAGYSTLFVLSGKLDIQAGEDRKEARANDLLVFHPRIQYSIYALEDSSYFMTHYTASADDAKVF